jgi:ferredoxin
MATTMTVNGTDREVPGDGTQTLLDALRDDLGITGPKLGCGEGACGACTVLVGSRAVQACQVDAASVARQRITTVEGLAEDGILHPVQQAWLELGAMQCGYCTPSWPGTPAAAVPIRGYDRRYTAPPTSWRTPSCWSPCRHRPSWPESPPSRPGRST